MAVTGKLPQPALHNADLGYTRGEVKRGCNAKGVFLA